MEEGKDKVVDQKGRRGRKTADRKTIIDYHARGQMRKTITNRIMNFNTLKVNDS